MTDNKDLNQRFDKLEARLDSMASCLPDSRFPAASRGDEIDLRELFGILWRGKFLVLIGVLCFSLAGVGYRLSQPDMYRGEGVYAVVPKDGQASVSGDIGGLAAIAGIRIGGGDSNDIDQALELLVSWPFVESVVDNNDLKPLIYAVDGWIDGDIVWDQDLYDPHKQLWEKGKGGISEEPSSYESYRAFKKMVSFGYDSKSSMIRISVEHYSPIVAKNWVDMLVHHLNEYFRVRDIVEAKENIQYLEQQVSETSLAEMQVVFYEMIETQLRTLMLAEVGDEYLLKEVVAPMVMEEPVGVSAVVVFIVCAILGGVIVSMYLLIVNIRILYG